MHGGRDYDPGWGVAGCGEKGVWARLDPGKRVPPCDPRAGAGGADAAPADGPVRGRRPGRGINIDLFLSDAAARILQNSRHASQRACAQSLERLWPVSCKKPARVSRACGAVYRVCEHQHAARRLNHAAVAAPLQVRAGRRAAERSARPIARLAPQTTPPPRIAAPDGTCDEPSGRGRHSADWAEAMEKRSGPWPHSLPQDRLTSPLTERERRDGLGQPFRGRGISLFRTGRPRPFPRRPRGLASPAARASCHVGMARVRKSVQLAQAGPRGDGLRPQPELAIAKARTLARRGGVDVDFRVSRLEDWDWSRTGRCGFVPANLHPVLCRPGSEARPLPRFGRGGADRLSDQCSTAMRPSGGLWGTGGPRRSETCTTGGHAFPRLHGGWEVLQSADYDAEIDEGIGPFGPAPRWVDFVRAQRPGAQFKGPLFLFGGGGGARGDGWVALAAWVPCSSCRPSP